MTSIFGNSPPKYCIEIREPESSRSVNVQQTLGHLLHPTNCVLFGVAGAIDRPHRKAMSVCTSHISPMKNAHVFREIAIRWIPEILLNVIIVSLCIYTSAVTLSSIVLIFASMTLRPPLLQSTITAANESSPKYTNAFLQWNFKVVLPLIGWDQGTFKWILCGIFKTGLTTLRK